jgi:8-oxo-dGTP pyrophosphatase MutT (NUDIX family)
MQQERIGAVPYLIKGDRVIVLLVTSMSRARWIFPKGLPEGGETHEAAARREAFEEAGVAGRVMVHPITAVVEKSDANGKVDVPVTFYPLEVETIADKWPEKGKRLRHWVVLEDAEDITRDADTLKVLLSFRETLVAIRSAK